ncbi:MAG: transposase [Chitinophagales bacterium]|nr:transposase [Chitinophagales bacterium]
MKERKNIRLRNYDYSSDGLYFITICTKNRENHFGEIAAVDTVGIVGTSHVMSQRSQQMVLNEIGKIADEYLNDIPQHFSHVEMDEFIIMPNHVHCILVLDKSLVGVGVGVGTRHVVSQHHVVSQPTQYNQFSKPITGSVSVIIQQYKSSVKRWCNKNGHEYFQWQSRFHDHVIRDGESYERIKNYIINNPSHWNDDSLKTKTEINEL